jgi:hypothetical protein
MEGKIFEFVGKQIVPKDDCWHIAPLRAIIDEYPEDYPKVFYYLHCMKSMRKVDNPFADVPEAQRNEQIMRYIELYIDEESSLIVDALLCVEDIYATTFYRLYKGFKAYMDQAGDQLAILTPDFNKKDGNSDTVKAFIKDYKLLSNQYKEVYKDFDEEQGNLRVRGGQRLAYDDMEDD